ncbi:hypothetical protein OEZ85_002196 [Tetradesmus obliquus]|uniref:SF3 helicase domain-containing protein n=1 Tax=Tetradesmus obliquus TaxID=3088 RepID=A0ABY8U288_TETOB|nr:hypothetical protein OEZ85_002196 [Tetradesmus obliquus]
MTSIITRASPAHVTSAKGDEAHSMVLQELFDINAINACIAHSGIDAPTKDRLKAMHKRRTNGNHLLVTYNKNNKKGYGRLYAKHGLSLQMLPADVRNALCGKSVHDIDMVNAHPNFVLHLAKKHGWVCVRLAQLCCSREQVLDELQQAYGMNRGAAKVVLLKLLYLGGLPVGHKNAKAVAELEFGNIGSFTMPPECSCNTYTYLEELQAELRMLARNIAAQYPEHAKEAERQRAANNKTTGHPLDTAVSLVVSDVENRALLAVKRELEEGQGRRVTTLVYDGLHVLRQEGETELPAELLRACEAAIQRNTGAVIHLVQKPMKTTLELKDVEDPAAYEWLLAMLGRMLYRVGQLDNWQVMLYMYGLAGAGKSTVYKIWQHAFRKDAVEFLNGNTEDKFGLEKLRSTKAEVIMCMDVPSDKPTSSVLSQDLWQLAVEGGTVNVPGKGQLARSHTLRLSSAIAGNKFLDYKDSNGNVTRRVVAVRYQRYLPADQQDGDLEKTIVVEELPALIKRCNELYLQRARENGTKGIWHLLPEYYSAIRHNAAETVNPLREFLRAPCPEPHHSETRHFALYEEGATTPQPQLVLAMQTFMRLTHPGVRAPSKWSGDEVQPLYEEGYERKTVAICKACRQPHKTGCCEHYGSKNKTTTQLWLNLKLVAVEPAGRNHVDDWY